MRYPMSRHRPATSLRLVAALLVVPLLAALGGCATGPAAPPQDIAQATTEGPDRVAASPPLPLVPTPPTRGEMTAEFAARRAACAAAAGPDALVLVLFPDAAGLRRANRNSDFLYLSPLTPRTSWPTRRS